jgi:hypothetical protein
MNFPLPAKCQGKISREKCLASSCAGPALSTARASPARVLAVHAITQTRVTVTRQGAVLISFDQSHSLETALSHVQADLGSDAATIQAAELGAAGSATLLDDALVSYTHFGSTRLDAATGRQRVLPSSTQRIRAS